MEVDDGTGCFVVMDEASESKGVAVVAKLWDFIAEGAGGEGAVGCSLLVEIPP